MNNNETIKAYLPISGALVDLESEEDAKELKRTTLEASLYCWIIYFNNDN